MGDEDFMQEIKKPFDDPSGQSSAVYWNSFFKSLGGNEVFEWYTSPDEIYSLLVGKCTTTQNKNKSCISLILSNNLLILHPGSGNSYLPIYLKHLIPNSHNIVLECSEVALKEMIYKHDPNSKRERVDYIVGDVLQTLPFPNDYFDIWIDKGLVDALFNDSQADNLTKSQNLFREMNRVMKKQHGIVLITTLAQDHSLELIMNSIFEMKLWHEVSLYEVDPLKKNSSSLRPFVFCFVSKENQEESCSYMTVYRKNGEIIEMQFSSSLTEFTTLHNFLNKSRQEFASKVMENNFMKNRLVLERKKMQVTLSLKPCSDETDLINIKDRLFCHANFQFVEWSDFSIIPIGFGISKLVVKCNFPLDAKEESFDVEDFCESIQDWEDEIQSIEVESVLYT